jgi:hypothetical protein
MATAMIVALALAQASVPPGTVPDRPAIQAIQHILDDSVVGWNIGDLTRWAAPYSDAESSIFSGSREVLHHARTVAIEANRRYFTAEHGDERGYLRYETIEIDRLDAAHFLGFVRFELVNAGADHLRFSGVSSMLFAIEGGDWKIVMQNDSNEPPSESPQSDITAQRSSPAPRAIATRH